MADQPQNVTIENAKLIFLNFSGRGGPYNDPGDRNFAIELPEDEAAELANRGWNVKQQKPREDAEGEEGRLYLPVSVKYNKKPPRVVMISSTGRQALTEDTIDVVDQVEIEQADVVLNPFPWEVNGKKGIKAYLKTMFVTIAEDDLERKYALLDEDED